MAVMPGPDAYSSAAVASVEELCAAAIYKLRLFYQCACVKPPIWAGVAVVELTLGRPSGMSH